MATKTIASSGDKDFYYILGGDKPQASLYLQWGIPDFIEEGKWTPVVRKAAEWLLTVNWTSVTKWRRPVSQPLDQLSGEELDKIYDDDDVFYGHGDAVLYWQTLESSCPNTLLKIEDFALFPSADYFTPETGIKHGSKSLMHWAKRASIELDTLFKREFGPKFFVFLGWTDIPYYQIKVDTAAGKYRFPLYPQYRYVFDGHYRR
jgi:hypothetical protein